MGGGPADAKAAGRRLCIFGVLETAPVSMTFHCSESPLPGCIQLRPEAAAAEAAGGQPGGLGGVQPARGRRHSRAADGRHADDLRRARVLAHRQVGNHVLLCAHIPAYGGTVLEVCQVLDTL